MAESPVSLLEEFELCSLRSEDVDGPAATPLSSTTASSMEALGLTKRLPDAAGGKFAHLVILRRYAPFRCDQWTPLFLLERKGGNVTFPVLRIPVGEGLVGSIATTVARMGEFDSVRYMGFNRCTRGLFLYVEVCVEEGRPRHAHGRTRRFWEASLDELVNHRRVLHFDVLPVVTWETISRPWAKTGSYSAVVGYRGCCARLLPMLVLCGPQAVDPIFKTYAAAAKEAIWSADAQKRKGGVVRFLLFYASARLADEPGCVPCEPGAPSGVLVMHPSPRTRCCSYTFRGRAGTVSFHRLDADHATTPRDGRRTPLISP